MGTCRTAGALPINRFVREVGESEPEKKHDECKALCNDNSWCQGFAVEITPYDSQGDCELYVAAGHTMTSIKSADEFPDYEIATGTLDDVSDRDIGAVHNSAQNYHCFKKGV